MAIDYQRDRELGDCEALLLYALGWHRSSPAPSPAAGFASSSCRTTSLSSEMSAPICAHSLIPIQMHYAVSDVVLQQEAHV